MISVAAVVKDGSTRLGVLALSASTRLPLVTALDKAGDGIRIDVVDSTNRVVLSSDSLMLGHYLTGIAGHRSRGAGLLTGVRRRAPSAPSPHAPIAAGGA